MVRIFTSQKNMSFAWVFTGDGGAVGSFTFSSAFPVKAVFSSLYIQALTTVASLGSATISVGTSADPVCFVAGIPYQDLMSTKQTVINAQDVVNTELNSLRPVFTINVANLTAGVIGFQINYNELVF